MNMKKMKDIPRFEYETVHFYCGWRTDQLMVMNLSLQCKFEPPFCSYNQESSLPKMTDTLT